MNINNWGERNGGYFFILIFTLMAAGIALTGYIHYSSYERHFRAEVEGELSSIAELKASELSLWRRERLGDGAVLLKNSSFSALVRRFLEKPGDADTKRRLQEWMGKYMSAYHYTQVSLYDTQGTLRIPEPGLAGVIDSTVSQNVRDILRNGKVVLEDFHFDAPGNSIHLSVVVPIFDEGDTLQPLGVLALDIDPATYLYSFISRWPTPSTTGEVALVRKDGDAALFLSELKFWKNAPLNLRIPLTKTEVPAVRAVLGQSGIMEGVDYRGAPVIVAALPVPDSPWSLVVRINTSELFEPLRERLWLTLALISFFLFSAGAAMGLIWRQINKRHRERENAAKALGESEARFHQLTDATFEGVIITENGRILDVNKSFLGMSGYEKAEELVGKSVLEFVAPEYRGLVEGHMSTGYDKPYEIMGIRKDGSSIPIEVHGRTVETAGRRIRFTAVQDITERKLAEERLRKSESLLAEAQKVAKIGHWDWDMTSGEVTWSDEMFRIHGYEPGAITPSMDAFMNSVPEDDVERVSRIIKQSIYHGGRYFMDRVAVLPDGTSRIVHAEGDVERDGSGEPVRMFAVVQDVTESKENESRLKLFRDMLDLSQDAVYIIDAETARPVDFNKAAHEMLGYTHEDMSSLSILDIIVAEPGSFNWKSRLKEVKESGGLIVERNHRKKDGSLIPVETALTVVEMDGKEYLVAVARDLSERMKIREMEVAAKSLELTNRELQEFARIASHDMQEPLRTIIAFSDRLNTKFAAELSPKAVDYLGRIRTAGMRMSQLLKDILRYSLVSGGHLNFERVDLNHVVADVLEDMRGSIEGASATLSVSPLPVVKADPSQARQIFQNLISNAIKFRKPGEYPAVKIYGTKKPMLNGGTLWEVVVEDNGIGFDSEHSERIFKVFERLHGHSEYDGTGVGLATALKIVQRHGWTIKAYGKPGVGAKFTITMISPEG